MNPISFWPSSSIIIYSTDEEFFDKDWLTEDLNIVCDTTSTFTDVSVSRSESEVDDIADYTFSFTTFNPLEENAYVWV